MSCTSPATASSASSGRSRRQERRRLQRVVELGHRHGRAQLHSAPAARYATISSTLRSLGSRSPRHSPPVAGTVLRVPWAPPPRSPWADKMVALGRGLGDDGRSMISLRPDDLRAAAVATTGLDDFGDTWWEEPFARLCASLDGEARLHLPGRLRTRGEIQLILQNRLRMVDLWKREPAVLAERREPPIVVTGLGRSGTTLLHELLACDPDNRPPLLWELLHSVPYGDASGDLCDDEIKLMDEIVPAFTSMHENGGRLPTECIFSFAHQFSSDMYTGLYNVGQYTIWRSDQDQSPIYDWHKRHLQTLQWVAERPTPRWVVKAPSHLSALPLVFATYPDARVVITHRDPLRVIGSLADLMATLHWMHSDHVDHAVLVEFMAMGLEMQMDARHGRARRRRHPQRADRRRRLQGPRGRPVARGRRALRRLGPRPERRVPLRPRGLPRRPPHDRGPGHDYSFADTGLDLATHRALVAPYQERFGVPSEV